MTAEKDDKLIFAIKMWKYFLRTKFNLFLHCVCVKVYYKNNHFIYFYLIFNIMQDEWFEFVCSSLPSFEWSVRASICMYCSVSINVPLLLSVSDDRFLSGTGFHEPADSGSRHSGARAGTQPGDGPRQLLLLSVSRWQVYHGCHAGRVSYSKYCQRLTQSAVN